MVAVVVVVQAPPNDVVLVGNDADASDFLTNLDKNIVVTILAFSVFLVLYERERGREIFFGWSSAAAMAVAV